MADKPRMLVIRWGMIPMVQPKAAAIALRHLSARPVETVYITPVPGTRTTTRDVSQNSVLNISFPYLGVLRFTLQFSARATISIIMSSAGCGKGSV